MSYRNYLSRQDLYSHGLREGQAWGDDRRELEAALWEIDQLERQTEYEYQRPSPGHPWTSGRSSAWGPSYIPGGPSSAGYHDVQITRSNSDLYPNSESGMTSLASQSYARCNDGYQRGYGHRTYPSHAAPSVFRGYPTSQSSTISRDYQSPHYTSPLRHTNSNYQDFHDPMGSSHSSNHQNHDFAPSMAHSRTSSYRPSYYSQHSPQHSPAQRISTPGPGQLQMVTWRSGRNESPSPEHTVDPRHASATAVPPNMMSPHWSMVATEGTARSESPSVISSRGMYGQNLGDMEYASRTGSYEFYGSSDEECISDSVASDDTGYYYSSESDSDF